MFELQYLFLRKQTLLGLSQVQEQKDKVATLGGRSGQTAHLDGGLATDLRSGALPLMSTQRAQFSKVEQTK